MSSTTGERTRLAILAHGEFPEHAKTATGVMRYGDYEVVAVLDRETAGRRVSAFRSDLPDAPIVASMDDLFAGPDSRRTTTGTEVDALLVGIAPIGGGFDDSWRPDVRAALEHGCDVIAGLHYFLADDPEFADLAAQHDAEIVDVRRPDPDIGVSEGRAADVSADVVLTVGTDCSVGKMTASLELVAAARERGIDAAFVPTGQTGIMISGWGHPVDRVISDFAAGAVEEMILDIGDDHDLLVVEGQGSIVHPAYSGVTCSILHGAMPDALVLCHVAGREVVWGYESMSLPALSTYVDLYEDLAKPVHSTDVVAGALNTSGLDDDQAAREAVDQYAEAIGVPSTDLIRFGADAILEALE